MHLKKDKVDLKKKKREKKIFCIFFQSIYQVGMKNVVECYKEFFGYSNALETNGALLLFFLVRGLVLLILETKQLYFLLSLS